MSAPSDPRAPSCPVCRGTRLDAIARVENAPVLCNVLLPSRIEALASPVGDIDLAVCRDCSHVCNTSFDDSELDYTVDYENSLHFSPTFQEFAISLAQRLVTTYDIRDRQVVELGCGKGDFLAMLAAAGGNEAIGFDPSYNGAVDHHDGPGSVRVVNDNYQSAGHDLHPALVVTRHVLEHLRNPALLIDELGQWAVDDPVIYMEVPDADYMFRQSSVWDVIYEHPSYFTSRSLARLCTNNGLSPILIESPFGGQYLSIHARMGSNTGIEPGSPTDPMSFGPSFSSILDRWSDNLRDIANSGRSAAIWGAGSKGVSFGAMVPGASEILSIAIDLNPRKKGRYMPVSGLEVTTPDDLRFREVSLVLVMNPLYESEIREDLRRRGIGARVEVVV